jgi:glycosyltransferase involved in cell wall biosynthesis
VITWVASPRPRVECREGSLTIVRVPALARWNRDHPSVVMWANTAVRIVTGLLAALARRDSYASILSVGLHPEGIVAAIAARIANRPFVVHAWTSAPSGGSVKLLERSIFAPVWRRVLSGARAYVAETDETASDLARLGFPSHRIHVVPTGVDLELFAPVSVEMQRQAKLRLGLVDALVALYHGRFDLGQKRLDLLLASWRSADLSGWRLVLAGDGRDAAKVRELADALDPPVVFVGWQDDVRWLLGAADLSLLPTDLEGSSGALAEAMAFGLPVLASRVPGHDRLLPEGVVMVPNDHAAWTSALRKLCEDSDRRAALGVLARRWATERFAAQKRDAAYARLLDV